MTEPDLIPEMMMKLIVAAVVCYGGTVALLCVGNARTSSVSGRPTAAGPCAGAPESIGAPL
jgi:hypothetical protein